MLTEVSCFLRWKYFSDNTNDTETSSVTTYILFFSSIILAILCIFLFYPTVYSSIHLRIEKYLKIWNSFISNFQEERLCRVLTLYMCLCVFLYFFIYEWCPASKSLTAWVIRTFYRKIKISWTCLCGALFYCPSVFFSRQLSIMFTVFLNRSVLYTVRISLLLKKKMFFTLFFSSTPNLVQLFFCFI